MYENLHKENSAFSDKIPALQIYWDSTSLGLLKTCPRKYQLNMLDGWRKDALPLTFGIHYHSALEKFDYYLLEGITYDEALVKVARYILVQTTNYDKEGNITGFWESGCTKRNRYTLLRSVLWCLEKYRHDIMKTITLANGKPAVEVSFKIELEGTEDLTEGEPMILCGHMDRVVDYDGDTYIMDRKTTSFDLGRLTKQYELDNQMSLYYFAGNIVLPKKIQGIIIDACYMAVGFNRYGRAFVNRSKCRLDSWYEDMLVWLKTATQYAKDQHWPTNDTACTMYGGCPYAGICSKDKSMQDTFLKSEFKRERWNPRIER